MASWAARFLFGAILAVAWVQPAAADPIVVGAPGNAAYCIPFGCRDVTRYQQVYAAGLFPGEFVISAIAFPYTIDRLSNAIDPAEYEIRLSTTSRAVGGLSTVDLESNVGADATLVFAGLLAGEVPRGTSLSFTLPVPFTFDSGEGNLLLDVLKRGGVFFGDDGIYLDANTEMAGMSSSVRQFGTTSSADPTLGLVTAFSDAAPVPEPATLLLFGSGLAAALARRRKHLRN